MSCTFGKTDNNRVLLIGKVIVIVSHKSLGCTIKVGIGTVKVLLAQVSQSVADLPRGCQIHSPSDPEMFSRLMKNTRNVPHFIAHRYNFP